MSNTLTIAWKDLRVLFSDRGALILMLGAPLLLTLGLGLVTGAFDSAGGFGGLGDIPVAVVNQDEGELGAAFAEAFASPDLAGLFVLHEFQTAEAAATAVAANELAAALIIPPGFSAALLPDGQTGTQSGEEAPLQLWRNPARPISSGVAETIAAGVLNSIETNVLGVRVALAQAAPTAALTPAEGEALAERGRQMGEALAAAGDNAQLLSVRQVSGETQEEESGINLLAFMAPGMAVLFLMYTVSQGAGSLLAERDAGTLPRLLATPTSSSQILAGKVSGIYLSGVTQMGIVISASALLFGVRWGNPLAVVLLILAVVAGACGWGVLLAAAARSRQQVGSVGTAMMLIFGVLGGSFFAMPQSGALAALSKLTPNAWAIEGFNTLATGGSLVDLLPAFAALGVMTAVLFAIAALLFRRRSLVDL